MSLTDLSLRRPVTTLMVFVCLVVLGTLSVRMIPLELFPEFDRPVLFVQLPYPGSTPEEVERQIARPAEEALATITDLKQMRSTSYEDRAEVRLNFAFGTDTDLKAIEVREKLDGIRDQLPDDMQRVFIGQFSTADMPIMELRLSSNRDLSTAYELLERKLKQGLERIDGVSRVELQGVAPREVRIELKADRVAAHRVSLTEVSTALRRSDASVSAGRVTDGNRRFAIRPMSSLTTLEQIRNLQVSDAGVRLQDIADVSLAQPELDHGRHLNRTYAVGVSISKESGANTVAVGERIRAELDALRDDPDMTGINLYTMNSAADGITSSLRDLLESGLIGGVFALLVLFGFLRRVGTTAIVTLAVPISILVTVGALYFLGMSLNILSMMGLMLAVGMLVDNAVVVTESIHRHQHLDPENRTAATKRGVKEVALAVVAGTLTTAIVFLPMIVSQSDQVTLFLKHVSVAICVALGISLLLSLTVVPMLTARLSPPKSTDEARWITWLTNRYRRTLDALLKRRALSGFVILGVLLSAAVPARFVNMDFFPNDNTEREIRLHYHVNDRYTVDRVEEAVSQVEDSLYAHQQPLEIESVYSYYRADYAQSTILLTEDGETPVDDLEERIREVLPKLTVAEPSFTWENDEDGSSLRLSVTGPSTEILTPLSMEAERVLARINGLVDVRSDAERGDKEVRVIVDRDRARQYGFSSQEVGETLAAAMRGQPLRRFRTATGEVEMRLLFQDADRQSMDELRSLPLQRTAMTGSNASVDGPAQVPLGALARLQVVRGPQRIVREDRTTVVGITAAVDEDVLSTSDARDRIRRAMNAMEMPTGYDWSFGQRTQQEEESQNVMQMNLLLALALIYLVMAGLFESLIHPAAIWTSILFAVVGVLWFFLMTGTTFSIMAWIGVLVLIGIVVNNGIVLIDHVNTMRAKGLRRHDAIMQAAEERMRPILMTAATTILGLIPLCLGTTQIGGDGPAYFPMARAIVGGLAFSTVVTLLILPAVYVFFDDLRRWGRSVASAVQ